MPSKVELLALSSLLLQIVPSALAHPAKTGFWPWDTYETSSSANGLDGSNPEREASSDSSPYPYPLYVSPEHGVNQLSGGTPDKDKDHCACTGGGGKGGEKGHEGGKIPTLTISHCPANPTTTATITVTTTGDASTETSTETITTNLGTITETATLTETTSDCTATTTDWTTYTTPGPTVTETETATETETTTATETATETETQTSTITTNQIITATETTTQTDTLKVTVTSTVTDSHCTSHPSPGGLGCGSCKDPSIKYEYGLDGQTEYAYTANNQKDFSFGSSSTIGSVADLICNRLRSPCNAPQDTIDQCYAAESAVSGLEGQEAADTWNKLMA